MIRGVDATEMTAQLMSSKNLAMSATRQSVYAAVTPLAATAPSDTTAT
jgi:hypothetical protein